MNRLYEDTYGFLEDVAFGEYDMVSYDEATDAWENLYDFYGEVFEEFYDGNDDVKAVYEKIYKND